jgi:hypothetical protein
MPITIKLVLEFAIGSRSRSKIFPDRDPTPRSRAGKKRIAILGSDRDRFFPDRDPEKFRSRSDRSLKYQNNHNFAFFVYRKTPHIVPRTDRAFLFFLGVTSGILCATVYFFFNYFGSIFTQFRPGHRPQKSFFLNFFPFFIAI